LKADFLVTQLKILCHFFCQNSIPEVVLRDPIRKKKGIQTSVIAIAKFLKLCSWGIFVMPKTEVTKVRGRKKIET
jgi:hypothetical protein